MPSLRAFVEDAKPVEWVVPGLVPAGLTTLIASPAGSGKSWLLEHMAVQVARGEDVARHFAVGAPGPVLLVDQDTPQDVLAQRLDALAPGMDIPVFVESQLGIALDTREGVARLQALVARYQPVLVVLETLDTLTSPDFRENYAENVNALFASLKAMQSAYACAMAITHHLRKPGQQGGDPISLIRGSSALPARADVVFALQHHSVGHGDEHCFLVQPFPKRVQVAPPFRLKLETDNEGGQLRRATLRWQGEWEPSMPTKLLEGVQEVEGLIDDRPAEGSTVNEIKEAAGGYLSDRDIREILRFLEQRGRVRKGVEAHNRFRFFPLEQPVDEEERVVSMSPDTFVDGDEE